ncbi:DNA internalization-related competence protein ComEC/Rec2 [Lysinibacillus telephonicus]|uniref:DNA internalization-related competence protein ComEC/Rec2 n=1 Tax=Lysinibacillus telephonicus TaxID=1714840 RepID=A0A3S0J5I2_9BACI|nr:DNA internalization-related competence protein ComEC/Rec2 [Lysinibacillus telephonicus]RTQ95629.1 DNA internalization-related competence protein ComEC/Rec2 [Lysinibacillus telephonicus]
MNYLILFKHKCIFYALSVLVASLAATESARLLLLLALLLLFCIYKKITFRHLVGIMLLCFISYYYFSFQINKVDYTLNLPATLTWTGEYKINGDMLRGFMVDESGKKVYVAYQLASETEKIVFEESPLIGKQYIVHGTIKEPSKPAHSYAFSMEQYLKSKGSIGILEVSNWSYIQTKESIPQRIGLQRFKLKKHIEETFPESLVGEAQALLIGLGENVDDDTTRAYQKLGITHLFAISGLHIAIVSLLFFQGLLRLKIRREFAMLVLIVVLPIYAILVGGAPSVWRAVSVVELTILSRIKWRLPVDDALAISFILFIIIEPWSVYQIGFQLSYLATAALIYSSRLIRYYSSWIVQSFFITFVCQLLVYPLLLLHFFELSISSLVVNIFFVPLFSFVILPINIILLVVSFFPGALPEFMFSCYEPIRTLLTKCINLLQDIPYQMWNPGKPSIVSMLIAYGSVFATFYYLDIRAKLVKILSVLLIPMCILHFSTKVHEELIISFINVGQGDCIVIELPYRKAVYMIDTGGLLRFEQEKWKQSDSPYEIGRDIVVPFLKGKGIQKIDKLILTHADADHVEGAEEILQEINVEEIHLSPNSYYKEVMNDLVHDALKKNISIQEQIANNAWAEAGISFQYLWPVDTQYEGNNDSLVLYVAMGEFKALFMGDVEHEGEEEILRKYPSLTNIDLLKAGHHGSKTSSSEQFVNQMKPVLTIFSAGENNRYGHPHEEVVSRFQSLGLRTFTTGKVGTIEVKVKGDKLEVTTSN